MKANHFQKSQTLLYVSFTLLAVIALTAVVITSIVKNLKTASYQSKGMDAFQLAMAGIERAKVGLSNDWNNWTMDSDGQDDIDETEKISLGQGQYWVWVDPESPDPSQELIVASHGWVDDAHEIVEVVIERTATISNPCWVADRDNDRVLRIVPNDSGGYDILSRTVTLPLSVSSDPATGDCWVSTEGGTVHRVYPDPGGTDGYSVQNVSSGFDEPYVSVDSTTGDCWVAARNEDKVYRLHPDVGGGYTRLLIDEVTNLDDPYDIDFNSVTGDVWIAFKGGDDLVARLHPNVSGGYDQINFTNSTIIEDPWSVSVNSANGDVWIADNARSWVYRFRPNPLVPSDYDLTTVTGFNQPWAVSVDSVTGDCWVADYDNDGDDYPEKVVRLRPNPPDGSGGYDSLEFTTGFGKPLSVSVDSVTGDCWVVDDSPGRVIRIRKNNGGYDVIEIPELPINPSSSRGPSMVSAESSTAGVSSGPVRLKPGTWKER